MARIFVNYRTGDGEFAAAMLHLHLAGVFGIGSTFLASQAIAAGRDFEREILDQLAACTVVLAVIGPRWLESADDTGRARLELADDWVRRELVEAFDRGITVIPVLLDDRPRLGASSLPSELAALGRCQYVRLRHRHAGADLDRVVAALRAADDQMLPVLEADLRAYLDALAAAMSATQSWMPYRTTDSAYLDRAVTVHGDAPPGPPDDSLYQDGSPLRHTEVPWAQAIRQVPVGVVLGDAGLGKTWLLRRHCLELCRESSARLVAGDPLDAVPLPMFVHARQLAGWGAELRPADGIAEAALSGMDLRFADRARLRTFLAARLAPDQVPGQLFVDALDEVFADEARDEVLRSLRWVGARARTERGPRVLVSSRIAGFTDPFGFLADDVPVPRYFELGNLTEHQVRRLWERWFEPRGVEVPIARLEPALAPGSAIRSAVRSPLVAAFAAWVAESESVTPNRSGLYGQVVDRFLGLRWKEDSPGLFRTLRGDPAARGRYRRAFAELAWRMAVGGQNWRDVVSVDECEQTLDEALTTAVGERSRTFEALRAFGILVQLGVTDDPALAWVHRSVHEFLVAGRLLEQPAGQVAELVDQRCWFRPEWADVLDFAIGLEAGTARRTVTDAVRHAALDDGDGLGWFAAVFTSAGAGSPDWRSPVVERVRRLYRAGVFTVGHLVRILALTPDAEPDELVRMVLTTGDVVSGGQEAWTALAWCGPPGLAALRSVVVNSADAAGAVAALRDVSPRDAAAAVVERLRGGLPVHEQDSAVMRELPAEAVERLCAAYRARPASRSLARSAGWTCSPAGRTELLANLAATDVPVRRAAVAGLLAGFGAELDTSAAETLLATALNDDDPDIRLDVRGALDEIGTDILWVRLLLDARHDELYRDLPGRIEDLDAIVARLVQPGPGTDLALMMIREEPDLLRVDDVRTAMAGISATAMDGALTVGQIEHVAAIVGAEFVELARRRLDGSVRLPVDRLRRLVGGLVRAAPADGRVFDLVCDCVGWNPDPALGVALRLLELPGADKVERLVARLLGADVPRPSVRVWTDVLWATMLELPGAVRTKLRTECGDVTRHLLETLG